MKVRTRFQTEVSDISSTLESRIERLCVSHSFMYRCTTSLAMVTNWSLRHAARLAAGYGPVARSDPAYQIAEREGFPVDLPRLDNRRSQPRRCGGGAAGSIDRCEFDSRPRLPLSTNRQRLEDRTMLSSVLLSAVRKSWSNSLTTMPGGRAPRSIW